MKTKSVLVIAAVAMFALAIGQVQAESINVPNGDFKMYKPGTDIPVVPPLAGDIWVQQIGMNRPLSGGGPVNFADGTTGDTVDIPGWITPITLPLWRDGADHTTNNCDLFQLGFDDTDGTTCLNAFTGWSGNNGGLAESSESLGNIIGGTTYTVSAMVSPQVSATSGPVTLQLLAGGVPMTASSAVTPAQGTANTWEVFSTTYDGAATAGFGGQPLTIRVGATPPHTTDENDPDAFYGNRIQIDNITLEFAGNDPYPAYDETVLVDEFLELSWTNLPAADSNDVWVDVWFGTEPNALNPAYDMTLKVTAGENTEAVIVDASEPDTYYWRINSYLNGADNINEPNMLEGVLLRFHAVGDVPPTVEIVTLDQMTWAGEGVPLDSTVGDDGISLLTIEWSADLPTGISAAFDPGTDVADTTVTLTRVPYSEALIVNAGFESPELADGDWDTATSVPGWSEGYYAGTSTTWEPYNGDGGVINPDAAYGYGGVAWQGENISWSSTYAGYDDGLSQTLPEVLAAETQYDLSVMVGTPAGVVTPAPYRIELLAGPEDGEVLLESAVGSSPVSDTWITASLTHTTGASPAQVGEPITIRLIAADSPTGIEVNFDEVVLTANPPFPPYPVLSGIQTVTVTVTVGDVETPTADSASIEIDVYDDPCHLAKVGEGKSAITDFNANCITALEDLAVVAAAWLDDYAATGPVLRPEL